MKLFTCNHCNQLIYFENSKCENCGHQLGFDTEKLDLQPLVAQGKSFKIYHANDGRLYNYCLNYQYGVCNWLVAANATTRFCKACDLNHTIPDLRKPEYVQRWKALEMAKHRLVFSLLRLKLAVYNKLKDAVKGIAFDFIADDTLAVERVLTGHDNGLITINIAEADDIEREMTRKNMAETYRTLLGHFRHEIGHYYWDRLIFDAGKTEAFRAVFGDESCDYPTALNNHYTNGPKQNWNQQFISSYAGCHPWEDWAETWAHYMHIMDTLETAYAFGLSVHPGIAKDSADHNTDIKVDPYRLNDFKKIFSMWLPLTFTMNSLNRSMGLPDSYPFIIPEKVIEKLSFIHQLCLAAQNTEIVIKNKTTPVAVAV